MSHAKRPSGRFAFFGMPMKKILIVAPAWIGDAIMAQPLYRHLHERWPGLTDTKGTK